MDPSSGAQNLYIYPPIIAFSNPQMLNHYLPAQHTAKEPPPPLPCLAPMDIRSWCKCSSGSSDGESVRLRHSSRGGSSTSSSAASVPPPPSGSSHARQRWKELWMRLLKERSKTPAEHPVPYDFYNYLQNFDQGIAWDEPENQSRSFSVRFADPASRILSKKRVVK